MDDSHITSINQLEQFNKGFDSMRIKALKRKQTYAFIAKNLQRFFYHQCSKKDKSIIKTYLMNMTGYSDAQMTRLIAKHRKTKQITPAARTKKQSFPTIYTPEDIALLILTDNAHGTLSGPAIKHIFESQYNIFGKQEYCRLQQISQSHIYNLRNTRQYVSNARTFQHTKPTAVSIGIRAKPKPVGKPGYLRVDSVHQGDENGEKGLYHINLVDEITQWEIVVAIPQISEKFMIPVLKNVLAQFPFKIINFHSDNGSEYINYLVANMLNKLHINQTKSRPRHSNDNGLVESKNASVIRKHIGHVHIPKRFAPLINAFYQKYLNNYLNFHRPCGFPTVKIKPNGKKIIKYNIYQTPLEKLSSLTNVEQYLKHNISIQQLNSIANKKSDNDVAANMQLAKKQLFKSIRLQS